MAALFSLWKFGKRMVTSKVLVQREGDKTLTYSVSKPPNTRMWETFIIGLKTDDLKQHYTLTMDRKEAAHCVTVLREFLEDRELPTGVTDHDGPY